VTRSQLLHHVAHFAGVLQASGIRPGDAVSLADTNTVNTTLAC
jgi:acyl-CoA synthetase (AMP-forming)/AMP-acid ligase II